MKNQPTDVERATLLVSLENYGPQTREELVESTGFKASLVCRILEIEAELGSLHPSEYGKCCLAARDWRETIVEGG